MLRKSLNNRRCFVKKVLLKISKKSQKNTCAKMSFLGKFQVKDCNFIKKRLKHRCFPVKYAKFILPNTSGGINKKGSKVHRQRVLLKIIYYYTTGWLLNEAFNVFLWNETKNSSCSINAENTVFVTLEPKIVDLLLKLYQKRDPGTGVFLWILRNF